MVFVLAGALILATALTGAVDTDQVGCGFRSEAGFPGAYSPGRNVVVGPLSLVGAGRDARKTPVDSISVRGGWKSPLLLRNGHSATITIAPAFRSIARLDYRHEELPFASRPSRLRVKACRRRSGSSADGRAVTFWSGDFALREVPACIEIIVRIDGGPARRRTLRFATGAGGCAPGASHLRR